jgi:hypothetical protein
MKHSFDWCHVCTQCQVRETKVDSREVSRMCSNRYFVFYAGPRHATAGYIFTSASGKGFLPGKAIYEPSLDYPDDCGVEIAYMAAVFEKPPEAETRPGLCPEQIDWAAHKAFLRELS